MKTPKISSDHGMRLEVQDIITYIGTAVGLLSIESYTLKKTSYLPPIPTNTHKLKTILEEGRDDCRELIQERKNGEHMAVNGLSHF